MDSGIIKNSLVKFTQYIPPALPPMGWYFSEKQVENAIVFEKNKWTCMFQYIEQVAAGKQLCFSSQLSGCEGAACYLGFKTPGRNAGSFLAQKEKFKKCIEYGEQFYKQIKAIRAKSEYLILSRVRDVPEKTTIEVINLWGNAVSLTGLVTLANYDRPTNNNVRIPFASGCQGMWTIPYKEKTSQAPKAIVGCMDPAMRKYIASDVLLFSVPSERFMELTENAQDSFVQNSAWKELLNYRG